MTTSTTFDASGTWKCAHWYPSNSNPGTEDVTYNTGALQRQNNQYVFESEPNEERSYFFVRMTIDDDLATGTWYESSSPTGEFAGAEYSGAFQALVSETGDTITGKWAGVGKDQTTGKKDIYTGRIEFTRQ